MQKWFSENYKLIKLNFILLGVFIFFLILQFGNSCYAVTQTELDVNGETLQEWATKIYNHYKLKENDKLYLVVKDVVNNVNVYKFYCIPVLTSNTTFLSANVSGGNGNNWGFNLHEYVENISNFFTNKLYMNNVNNLTIFNLEYDYNTGVYYSSNFVTNGATSTAFRNNVYKTNSDYLSVNNYCNIVSNYNNGYAFEDRIIYTNIKNYIKTVKQSGFSTVYEIPAKILNFDRCIKTYDYESYLNFSFDELGTYITIKNDLKNTNVANIVFNGSSVMNGTSYTASTMMNFDLLRIYGTGDVTVSFSDLENNVLYTYKTNFSCDEIGNDTQENRNQIEVLFDVNSSPVLEYNNFYYYEFMEMFFTFNNTMNYNTDITNGNDVYIPCFKFSIVFKDGHTIESQVFYYDFDFSYNITLNSGVPYFLQGAEVSESVIQNFFQSYYYVANDIYEYINKNNILFDVNVAFFIGQFESDGENITYKNSVLNKNYLVNFNSFDYGVNSVIGLVDSSNHKIGYIVVDSNGNIIRSNLIEGYIVTGNNVYNPDNVLIYGSSEENGKVVIRDGDGNVYKEIEKKSISERLEEKNNQVNDNAISNIAETITTIIDTIIKSLGALITSVGAIGILFASAFNWLPMPIPQLVVGVFCVVALFAIFRAIRGH